MLIAKPGAGAMTLTLALAIYFTVSGAFRRPEEGYRATLHLPR